MPPSFAPRRFLFVLWEGGGNVAPQLGLASGLVERGHDALRAPLDLADSAHRGVDHHHVTTGNTEAAQIIAQLVDAQWPGHGLSVCTTTCRWWFG